MSLYSQGVKPKFWEDDLLKKLGKRKLVSVSFTGPKRFLVIFLYYANKK